MITVKTFVFNPFQVNTYLVYNDNHKAILIDPACSNNEEFEQLYTFIKTEDIALTHLILTHAHIDHLLGLNYITSHYNIVPFIHPNEKTLIEMADDQALMFGLIYHKYQGEWQYIKEKDTIVLGNSIARILNVRGHSPGGIAIYFATDNCVFTGDALFKGSIGRTDLLGGDINELIQNIHQNLLSLPPSTMVFPGHGPHTTIEYEKKYNPFLK